MHNQEFEIEENAIGGGTEAPKEGTKPSLPESDITKIFQGRGKEVLN